jgi:hypothetical protein
LQQISSRFFIKRLAALTAADLFAGSVCFLQGRTGSLASGLRLGTLLPLEHRQFGSENIIAAGFWLELFADEQTTVLRVSAAPRCPF